MVGLNQNLKYEKKKNFFFEMGYYMFSAMPQIPGLKILLRSLEQLGLLCPVKNVFWIICTF